MYVHHDIPKMNSRPIFCAEQPSSPPTSAATLAGGLSLETGDFEGFQEYVNIVF